MSANNQFLRELVEYQLRPTIIDRVSDDLIFFGFPLQSCKSESDEKWLIQIYSKIGSIERTGFPNGDREFCNSWDKRYDYIYKQGSNFDERIPFEIPNMYD